MSNTTVKFITKEYSIPDDLLVYIDLFDLTNDARMALNKKFYQLLRDEEAGCIGDDQIRPEIDKQTGRFIAKLMEASVYDRTVTDYLSVNIVRVLIVDRPHDVPQTLVLPGPVLPRQIPVKTLSAHLQHPAIQR